MKKGLAIGIFAGVAAVTFAAVYLKTRYPKSDAYSSADDDTDSPYAFEDETGGADCGPDIPADLSHRLRQLERSVRTLTGDIELLDIRTDSMEHDMKYNVKRLADCDPYAVYYSDDDDDDYGDGDEHDEDDYD